VASVARALASRFDVQLYLVDDHAAAHEPRLPRVASGTTSRELLDSFLNTSRHRFRLVLEDLRGLRDAPPAVVAGPQLLPTSVAAVLRSPAQALFVVSDPHERPALEALVAQRFLSEARDLQLTVLRADTPLEELVERAGEQLAALSGGGDRSP
jgi:hypothetical protein